MSTLETLAVVCAVYGVVFLAHHASAAIDRRAEPEDEGDDRREIPPGLGPDRAVGYTAYN